MTISYVPTLQEEVNRKAYAAVAELATAVSTGVFAPAQADYVLQILQTAFNGIVTDGEFCDTITEFSANLKTFIPLKQSLKISLIKETKADVAIEISGCRLCVGNQRRDYDTPYEAYAAACAAIERLQKMDYRFATEGL